MVLIICKDTKLKTLVSSLALQKIKGISEVTKQDIILINLLLSFHVKCSGILYAC